MTNASNLMDIHYNLTKILSPDIITDTATWTGALNTEVGGWIAFGIILSLGIILFFVSRNLDNVGDAEAGMYAGFVSSIIGIILFVISIPMDPGSKILTWAQITPFIVFTAVMIFVYKSKQQY